MQDKYVSLHPEFVVQKQQVLDREQVYERRYKEAAGGDLGR
jgi:hypothetical protein